MNNCLWKKVKTTKTNVNITSCGNIYEGCPEDYCPFCDNPIEYEITQEEIKRFYTDPHFLILKEEFLEQDKEKIAKSKQGDYYVRYYFDGTYYNANKLKEFCKSIKLNLLVYPVGKGPWHTGSISIQKTEDTNA